MLFSVDIETTGLDPRIHSIVEIAIIAFEPLEKEPKAIWHRYIIPDGMVWTEYCLRLHHKMLIDLSIKCTIPRVDSVIDFCKYANYALPQKLLISDLMFWMRTNGMYESMSGKYKKMVACGKNFGGFDQQFINQLEGGNELFKHRSLDPALYFMKPDDELPPDLAECKKRAEAQGCTFNFSHVSHTAKYDALDVMYLMQHVFQRKDQKSNG